MQLAVDTMEIKSVVTDWINHIISSKRWSATHLARAAKLSPSTILRIMNDPNHKFAPSLRTLQSISDASGYPIPRSVLNAMSGTEEQPRVQIVSSEPDVETQTNGMIKVEHVSALPSSIRRFVDKDASVEVSANVSSDATSFAFYAPDNRLAPMIRAGSLMFATRRREAHEGDMILVRHSDGRSVVSFLKGRDENGLHLSDDMETVHIDIDFDRIEDIAVIEGHKIAA